MIAFRGCVANTRKGPLENLSPAGLSLDKSDYFSYGKCVTTL